MSNIFGGGLFGGGFLDGLKFANGKWQQHNDPQKITITGELPDGTDPSRVFAEAHGKELLVSMQERSVKRQQKGNAAAVGSKEEKMFERKFLLPFEFEDKDIALKVDGQKVSIEVPVPQGVVVETSDQQPESSTSSFSYSSDGDSGLAGGLRHMSAFSSSAQGFPDLSHFFGPVAQHGGVPISPFAALFGPILGADPFTQPPRAYNQDASQDKLVRAPTEKAEGAAGAAVFPQIDTFAGPTALPLMMMHPFMAGGFPSLLGHGGLGGALPIFQNVLSMPSMGSWHEGPAQDGGVVISGTFPPHVSLDQVQVSAKGRHVMVKDEADEVGGLNGDLASMSSMGARKETRIFRLPFEVSQNMLKVDKDATNHKLTITVAPPSPETK